MGIATFGATEFVILGLSLISHKQVFKPMTHDDL
jgi:hypothetical protein